MQRMVYNDWVPKKLEVEIVSDLAGNIDLTQYAGNNCELQEGEVAIPEAEAPDMVEPELDMGVVNTLIANGVPELAAKHAVHNAGANADEAIMWFYSNIENPVVSTPLLVPNPAKKDGGAASGGFEPDG